MLQIIYLSGTFAAILFALLIFLQKRESLSEKILLYSVSIMPLGKLVYFPISGLVGLKIQFVVTSLAGIYGIYAHGVRRDCIKLIVLTIVPVISILWLEDPEWFFINHIYGVDQTDSVGLRLVTLALLVMYFMFVYGVILRNRSIVKDIATKYIQGTIVACMIGVPIFIGVWNGVIAVEDLLPISADTHIVDGFYRFNPGANVNEFSMILAFAIFLLAFVSFSGVVKNFLFIAFLIFEFATLTRASWIALIIAAIGMVLVKDYSRRNLIYGLFFFFVIVVVFYMLYLSSPVVQDLIISRTTLDMGASGEDRLDKFQYVFDRTSESPFRLLLGYGWSTNLYVHNVYLQLLYEIGIVGLFVYVIFFLGLFRKVVLLHAGKIKEVSVAILLFIGVCAIAHHTLYHVQTWFMLALVAAIAHSEITQGSVFLANRRNE